MLAACRGGGGNNSTNAAGDAAARYELPGGRFDRARFRSVTIGYCRTRLAGDPAVSAEIRELVCRCVAERLLADNDEAALRAMVRDGRLAVRRNDEALRQCRSASDLGGGEELPPPLPLPEAPGAAPARAVPPLASYISSDDYPAAALRNEEQGSVAFTLDVGPEGRVTACRIRQSSGSAALDGATCRIMRSRARYRPARNARGDAVPGSDRATVQWVLPAE